MAFEVWNALVLLDVVAPDDGALEGRSLVDKEGSVFALDVTRWNFTPTRARRSCSVRTFYTTRSDAPLLGFRVGTSGQGDHWTRVFGLGDLVEGGRSWVVFLVVFGGRNIVRITVGLGAIGTVEQSRWAGRRG